MTARSALLWIAAVAGAQPEQPPPADPVEESLAEGYQLRPPDEPAGSLAGGLIAVVPGALVHGAGHWYVGDRPTAVRLLLAELTGVVLVVGSELLGAATNDSGELGAPRRVLTHAGGLLFVGSWAADIVGSFKGAESFAPDSTRLEHTALGIGYRFTNDPLSPARHHIVVGLDADVGWLYVRPKLDVDAGFDSRRGDLDLGVRVLRGEVAHDHLAVGTRVRRVESVPYGVGSWGVAGYLGLKGDLGHVVRSLRHLYLVSRLGGGVDWYQLSSRAGTAPGLFAATDFRDDYFLLETGLEVNSGARTHLSLLVVQDPTSDVAPLTPVFGVLETALVHRYSDDLDIEARVTLGDGWALGLGLRYGL